MLFNKPILTALTASLFVLCTTAASMQINFSNDKKCSNEWFNAVINSKSINSDCFLLDRKDLFSLNTHNVDQSFFGRNLRVWTYDVRSCDGDATALFELTNVSFKVMHGPAVLFGYSGDALGMPCWWCSR
jgi:hypothetical protein